MVPLAVRIRSSPLVKGLPINDIEERISLYADDTLVYLADPCDSHTNLLAEINTFGYYSRFRVNWDKSTLFPLDQAVIPVIQSDSRLQVTTSFRYLGVTIQLPLSLYVTNNLCPLLLQLQTQTKQWKDLPLDLMGRANILKMIYLPKLLYVMVNSPYKNPKSIFKSTNSICI